MTTISCPSCVYNVKRHLNAARQAAVTVRAPCQRVNAVQAHGSTAVPQLRPAAPADKTNEMCHRCPAEQVHIMGEGGRLDAAAWWQRPMEGNWGDGELLLACGAGGVHLPIVQVAFRYDELVLRNELRSFALWLRASIVGHLPQGQPRSSERAASGMCPLARVYLAVSALANG
jgi:hypothetical protein